MAGRSQRALSCALVALALLLPQAAKAQAPGPDTPAPVVQPAPQPAAPPGAETPAAGAGEQDLRRRVEQLEEQLVDLQVVIGTLESLARRSPAVGDMSGDGGSGGGQGGGLSTGDQVRLDGLETQIRALTSQLEQLSNDVRGQGTGQRRSDVGGSSDTTSAPDRGNGQGPATDRFGSTTVTSSSSDPIGSMLSGTEGGAQGDGQPRESGPAASRPGQIALTERLPDPASANPKQLYEMAYGYLLQQNYGSAQTGFSDFLKRYPKDPLAPNALYWLGETHYVQRNYADAAEAFDLVLASYGESAKAPDAGLKRAMSLAQLGKKKEACTALRDLDSKYPNAPAHVKSKVESERERTGCQ